MSNEDMAAVLAGLLKNPEPYIGQRLRPTGPKSLNNEEVAAILSKVTGRKVRYRNVPDWIFLKAGFSIAKEFGYDDFAIAQAAYYNQEFRDNKFDKGSATDVVRLITGREPEDFETTARRYLNNSPYAHRSFGNFLAALRKFMTLPLQKVPNEAALKHLNKQ